MKPDTVTGFDIMPKLSIASNILMGLLKMLRLDALYTTTLSSLMAGFKASNNSGEYLTAVRLRQPSNH